MPDNLPEEYLYGGRECPYCHKPIYDNDALSCIYCGMKLPVGDTGLLSKLNTPKGRFFLVILVSLIIIGFLLWLIL